MNPRAVWHIIVTTGRIFRDYPIIPAAIVLTAIVSAIFADYIAPYDPIKIDYGSILLPPFFADGGSLAHVLGTDTVGRDILSRIIHGSRISLVVGLVAVSVAATLGICLGLIAGYIWWLETIIMRVVDVILAIPYLFGALLIASVIALPGLGTVIGVIAAWTWPTYARMIRAEVLSLREKDFVTLARISGASTTRIMLRHLLPNTANTILVLMTLDIGRAILFEAALSFLGVGIPPPTPSWGLMTAEGRSYLASHWWLSTMPGFVLFVLVSSVNFLGDWLTIRLDPKRRLRG